MAPILQCRHLGKLPHPIGDLQGLALDDGLLIFGGAVGDGFSDSIWKINAQTGDCTKLGRLPYACRGHQVVLVGSDVYLLGGFDGQTRNDLFRLDLESDTHHRCRPMPISNSWFAATAHNGKIVITGGFTIPDGYLDRFMIYDPQKDEWTVEPDAFSVELFPNRKLGSNVVTSYHNSLVLFGGADEFDRDAGRANGLGTSARYDPASKKWNRLKDSVLPREGLALVRDAGSAFLIGGMAPGSDDAATIIEKVDLSTGAIREFAKMNLGRLTPAVGLVGRRLIIAGGVIQPLVGMTDTIECLDVPS